MGGQGGREAVAAAQNLGQDDEERLPSTSCKPGDLWHSAALPSTRTVGVHLAGERLLAAPGLHQGVIVQVEAVPHLCRWGGREGRSKPGGVGKCSAVSVGLCSTAGSGVLKAGKPHTGQLTWPLHT